MEEFNEILKKKRKEKGLTQEELGKMIHVSRSAIAKYENGLGLPSEEVIQLLLSYFEITRDELLPQKDGTPQLIEKNKTIHRQKNIIIGFSAFLAVSLITLSVIGIINLQKQRPSGGLIVLKANQIEEEYQSQARTFSWKNKTFGYRNAKRDENQHFVLAPQGQIWSMDGCLDYLMGYYNAEGTSLYLYETPQNAIQITSNYKASNGKYCFNTSEYAHATSQFVITNETEDEINIGYIEFWC